MSSRRAVEVVEGVLGLVDPGGDLVAVLAAGLLVDQVTGLVETVADLVAVLVHGVAELLLRVVQETHVRHSFVVDVRPVGVPAARFAKLATVSTGPNTLPVVAVVGATASGKSALALDLAERLGGEIVNTDSMQVYRGMDIGTAKLPLDERRGITHHLLDVLDVTEPATVAEFQRWAREVIDDCREQGSFPGPGGRFGALHPRDPRRVRVPRHRSRRTRAARGGARRDVGAGGDCTRGWREVDPAAAAQVLPSNGRRVVRALEVIEITGRPFTASLPEQRYHYDHAVQIGVDIDRETLDRRIEQRVEQMWEHGFVDEVRALAEPRPAGGAYGEPGTRLPAGPRLPRRRAHRGRGAASGP